MKYPFEYSYPTPSDSEEDVPDQPLPVKESCKVVVRKVKYIEREWILPSSDSSESSDEEVPSLGSSESSSEGLPSLESSSSSGISSSDSESEDDNDNYIVDNHLIIEGNDKTIRKKLEELIRYVYRSFTLDYEEMDKKYGNIESKNSSKKFSNNQTCYDDEYFHNYLSNSVFLPEDYKYKNMIKQLEAKMASDISDDLCFKNIQKIILINTTGMNQRISGPTKLDWKLYFWKQYTLLGPDISLDQFVIACYKIKSHKFDYWTEYFYGIDSINVHDTSNGKIIVIKLVFNHN